MSSSQARRVLRQQASQSQASLATLYGRWVPQVSSKCLGVTSDLEPGYIPDGRADTLITSEAQILAFHVALATRFDIMTVTGSDIGIKIVTGACSEEELWLAIVPQPTSGSGPALSWCRTSGLPKDECAAVRIVAPSSTGSRVVYQD